MTKKKIKRIEKVKELILNKEAIKLFQYLHKKR